QIDPPPDLVLEIDLSRSSINRIAIYGVMGVPEVWRYHKNKLSFLARQPDGRYATVAQSLSLPPLTPADLTPFLAMRASDDENTVIRQFRAWIKKTFLAGGATPPTP
ncbi:MAG TPA: hypothetical protein VMS17_16110, partial [Gemmataceae bacterium]|nr:hypothetical protein [Gemmataceae bacterium]